MDKPTYDGWCFLARVARRLRRRPWLCGSAGGGLYIAVGLTFAGLGGTPVVEGPSSCPVELFESGKGDAGDGFSILQGNLWMLPHRPLLVPFRFAPDRRARLERLIGLVEACRPDVVALQEVFETSVVRTLERMLPEYRVHTSGLRDVAGSVNVSGLVTLTRVPARDVGFRPFSPLPADAKLIERLGRKGLLATEVGARGLHATVINAHLYASRHRAEERLALRQASELVEFVEGERARGMRVIVLGDFNLERGRLQDTLGDEWALSRHGPTYDPSANPYTVRGANDTRGNHEDRALARGRKAVDFLALRRESRIGLSSEVLERPLLSDHHFLAHRIDLGSPRLSGVLP